MADLIERLRNPAWIYSHVSVNARAELDEDQAVDDMAEAAAEIERLRHPYRAVDDEDWEFIMGDISDGGRGRFWKAVLTEVRAAISTSQRAEK